MIKFQAIVLDEQLLFAAAFCELLKSTNNFESVEYSNKLDYFKEKAQSSSKISLFIDYLLPNVNTLSEIRKIRLDYPSIKIIILGVITNPHLILLIQKAGANGFISKNSSIEEIEDYLKSMDSEHFYVSENIKDDLINLYVNGHNVLFTAREHEILNYIYLGKTIVETANLLNLSKHTVIAHRRNMMEKTGVNSVTGLINKAKEQGML
jgi:two-component system, NarL family, response regulator FusR